MWSKFAKFIVVGAPTFVTTLFGAGVLYFQYERNKIMEVGLRIQYERNKIMEEGLLIKLNRTNSVIKQITEKVEENIDLRKNEEKD